SYKVILQVLKVLGYSDLPNPLFTNDKKRGDLMKMLGRNDLEDIKKIIGFTDLPFELLEFNLDTALKGNTGDIKILFHPDAFYNQRLVLFGDSFFEFGLKVYSLLFSEVIYFRKPYILDDIVKILEPDIVLTSNTERYLYNVSDCHRDKPWFINYISKRFNSELLDDTDRKAFEVIFSGRKLKYKKII
ncbi:MAG: hypothetical protein ACTH5U_07505, partial [Pseudomonadales bacterium]